MKNITLILLFIFIIKIYFSQNVGIGTINPTNSLHVVPTLSVDPLKIEGLNQYITEQNILITDPLTGIVRHMHIDSLVNLISSSINTDDQNIDSLSLNGTILTTYIENGNSASVDLSNLSGPVGSDNQNIDSLTVNGTILTTYIENGSSAFVDLSNLSGYGGTDDQTLTLGPGTASTSIIDIESSPSDIIIQAGTGINLSEFGNVLTISSNSVTNPNPTSNIMSTGCECENTFDSLNLSTIILPVTNGDSPSDVDLDSNLLKTYLNQNICYIPLRIPPRMYNTSNINIELPKSGTYKGKRFKLFLDIRSSANIGLNTSSQIIIRYNKRTGTTVSTNSFGGQNKAVLFDGAYNNLVAISSTEAPSNGPVPQGKVNYSNVICLYDAGDFWIITNDGDIWEK